MAIQITPLLDLDEDAFSGSVDLVVDQIRHDVPSNVNNRHHAEQVLVRLGLTETQARQRIRFCLGEH